jgi:hypothetical protein
LSGEVALPEDVSKCLSDHGVLGVFERLPAGDQRNFIRWIISVDSPDERLRRALVLCDALGRSPLAWEGRPGLPNSSPG